MNLDRVTDSNHARNAQDRMAGISVKISKLNNDIATGQRVHQASDNPDSIRRSMDYKTKESAVVRYDKNASVAETIVSFSSKALMDFNDVIVRAQELAALSGTDLAKESFGVYALEVSQILEQAVDLGNTRHLGQSLFGGTVTNTEPFTVTRDGTGKITAVAFVGNTDQAQVNVADNIMVSPYADGQTTGDLLTIMNTFMALRDALEAADPTAVQGLHTGALGNATGQIGTAVAKMGTISGRIEFAKLNNEKDLNESEKVISKETSTNLTDAIVDLKQLQVAYEAATVVYGKVLGNLGMIELLRR